LRYLLAAFAEKQAASVRTRLQVGSGGRWTFKCSSMHDGMLVAMANGHQGTSVHKRPDRHSPNPFMCAGLVARSWGKPEQQPINPDHAKAS
jgi:hypothetical protein